MLTDAEVKKAAQLLVSRYGARDAHSAASLRCLELTAMGEIDAAMQWQAIADALETPRPQSIGNPQPKGSRLVG